MQIETHVKIPATRYIELLEIEIRMLKRPVVTPGAGGCNFNEVTKRIRATGVTVKQWSEDQGFRYGAVRDTICGHIRNRNITDALVRSGFAEA